MNDQKNTILAIVLSALVLIGWQIFFGMPQMEKQKQQPAAAADSRPQPATPAAARADRHSRRRRRTQPAPGHRRCPASRAPCPARR